MESEILRKKLSSLKGEGGRMRKVSNEMLLEVLNAWKLCPGSARDFSNGMGLDDFYIALVVYFLHKFR